jgi:5-methylcytosine-specific restriction endonuclease McrA
MNCAQCGCYFEPKRPWAKFCSSLCKERYRAQHDPGRQRRSYDPERESIRQKKRYDRDPEKARERALAWHRSNPERSRHNARAHKYRVKGALGSHTSIEWAARLAEFNHGCAYCPNPAVSKDHLVAISQGGSNSIENIVPACRSCNSSKGAKALIWEWVSFVGGRIPGE